MNRLLKRRAGSQDGPRDSGCIDDVAVHGSQTDDPRLSANPTHAIFLARCLLEDWDPLVVLEQARLAVLADPTSFPVEATSMRLVIAGAVAKASYSDFIRYIYPDTPDLPPLIRQRRDLLPALLTCPELADLRAPTPWMSRLTFSLHLKLLQQEALHITRGLLMSPYDHWDTAFSDWTAARPHRSTMRTFSCSHFADPKSSILADVAATRIIWTGRGNEKNLNNTWAGQNLRYQVEGTDSHHAELVAKVEADIARAKYLASPG